MEKRLTCIVPGCTAHFTGATKEDIMKQVAEHAAKGHGMTTISPELAEQVSAAIEDVR